MKKGFFNRPAMIVFVMAFFTLPALSQASKKAAENQFILPAKTSTIPFIWQGDTVNGTWEPYTALLIPVKLKNCPRQFYMQFDLGSPYSLFYKNKLAAIRLRYPEAVTLSETGKLPDFSFTAGKTKLRATDIVVKQFDSTGINWNDKKAIDIIGTIGSDLIDQRTVTIDYPGKRLTISEAIPAKLQAKTRLTDFVYAMKRVLLPAVIKGDSTMLFFDTGSSMYELLTTKKNSEAMAVPGSQPLRSTVRSWDKYLTANSLATMDSIDIGGVSIPIRYTTYMEGVSSARVEQMTKMGIGGMTGNKIFLYYKLILDTKHKKFGILRGD